MERVFDGKFVISSVFGIWISTREMVAELKLRTVISLFYTSKEVIYL